MNKAKKLFIYLELTNFSIEEGLEHRNNLSDRITKKLYADKNGNFTGAGWFEGNGDISFEDIIDITKAVKSISESFEELSLWDIFIGVDISI